MTVMEKITLYLTAISMIVLLMFSCRSANEVIEQRTNSIYIQRLIPITLPADSSKIKALLECNDNNRVVVSQLMIEKSKNTELNFLLDSLGNLSIQSITRHDTIYLKSEEISTKVFVTEFKEVPAEFTNWERFVLKFGTAMFWIIVGLILFGIVYFILKLKRK